MPAVENVRHGMRYLCGLLLGLYLASPVYAFTPSQVPLLSASAVTPNVMLQVDNSGSMDTILMATGFDASANWGTVYKANYTCVILGLLCSYSQEQVSNGTADYVFIANLSRGNCSNGSYAFYRTATSPASTIVCIALADPAGSGNTRYPIDYLAYLVAEVVAGRSVTAIPTQSRLTTAISVALNLVQNNRSLRIGLAGYNAPISGNPGPGGSIKQVITDLSPVPASTYQSAVSQSTADANYNNLRNAISALKAEANTPLAETYYQVTRYMRGLAPSPSYSGSPATFTSPIQYRCQKNYGVVITDGLPTYDRTFPTNDPDDPSGWLPNWDRIANDGPNLAGDGEGDTLYLDDIAKFAYDIDMRKDARTPTGDLTGKSWDTGGFPKQNMNTYTIGFTLDNQMLIDAADSNHGRGLYFQANDSSALNAALGMALSDIYAKAGSGGGGTANSATLQSGTRFYQTLYDPTDWHGTIRAYSINETTGALGSIVWNTDTLITSSSTAPTFESWSTATTPTRISLDYTNFSTAQQAVLNANLPTGVTGAQLINWMKGTANASLRTRTRLLGDVVNSPLVAALPTDKTATALLGDTTYTTYLSNKAANMTSSLLVNANDGFFNVLTNTGSAQDGQRRYAYLPSTALSSLSTIASTTYGSGVHKFTVDGQLAVFDTQAGSATAWRTVAYGGTGAGGKGFFAIKLFEGTSNTISALWEVKAPDTSDTTNRFNNLGYAYSKPEVARMADGTGIMVVGNGYGSFTGRASLYVINANTGALITEIQTPLLNNETDNGLSSVRLRVNSQNVVQAAYAGDLKGRMWKFDLSGTAASSWKVAFNGLPLFTAPRGASQPITVQPLLIDHPLNGKLVYFGTGKFSETTDKQTTDQQAFYAIWDADAGTGSIVESTLQPQAVNGSVTGTSSTYFTSTSNDVDWLVRKGWYMPLATGIPYLGERIIYPAQTSRNRIIFTTAAVNSTDPCESTGTGRLFELNAATGSMLNYTVLDTNADGDITSTDVLVAGMGIGSGIPVLSAIVAGTGGANDNKYLNTGADPMRLLEKGGVANIYQRIMWRQIQ